nr:MAG TPA: hypothetical protein [Caudoviricetes sp.]
MISFNPFIALAYSFHIVASRFCLSPYLFYLLAVFHFTTRIYQCQEMHLI